MPLETRMILTLPLVIGAFVLASKATQAAPRAEATDTPAQHHCETPPPPRPGLLGNVTTTHP